MKMHRLSSSRWPTVMVLCTAACAMPVDSSELSETISAQRLARTPPKSPATLSGAPCYLPEDLEFIGGGGSSCTEDDCGSNTPFVNGYHVGELHLSVLGESNHDKVQYVGFALDGNQRELRAENGELYALVPDGDGGVTRIAGCDLLGGIIGIIHDGQDKHPIVIHGYREDTSWVAGSSVPIYNYLLTYPREDVPDGNVPICSEADANENTDLAWVVVLTEERYEYQNDGTLLPRVRLAPPLAQDWLNFACQGHALNKARRWEYYPDPKLGPGGSLPTTPTQRQAMLESITAAYCNARTFTEDGVALAWRNVTGTVDTTSLYGGGTNQYRLEIEAMWGVDGLVCLEQPRHVSREEVEGLCSNLPLCTELFDGEWPLYITPEELATLTWPSTISDLNVEVITYVPKAP